MRTRPRSIRLASIAAATALALVASGCTLLGIGPYGKDDPSAQPTEVQQSTQQQPSPTTAAPQSPGGDTPAPVDPNDVPVASYDASKHETWPDAPTSPDRTNLSSNAKPDGFADPPAGQGMDRYLNQRISWQACGDFQCGTVLVPLNWDEPDGQAITLKMKKRPASAPKQGSMFINPGGPGGSGQEYVEGFEAGGFPGYDIIGWDTRGAGESTPVKCASNAQMDEYNDVDISPDDDPEFTALENAQKDFAKWCRDQSGALLDHISTIDTARDLDYLRYLVGDKHLTYLGVSYGTFIGSVYAELYPKRASRLVLDSAVNITDKDTVIQAMGFDLALKEFGAWCARQQECPYGETQDAVVKDLTDWFASLDQNPIRKGSSVLTQNEGVLGVAAFLYSGEAAYVSLLNSLRFAREAGEPQYLELAAGFLIGKDENGNYGSLAFSFPAIACADSQDGGAGVVKPEWDDARKKAPIFGNYMGPGMQCTYWSAKPMANLKLTAKGAQPILVLGATGDPATPYEQAVWMAEQLESGTLVTWKGAGHGVYSLGNQCAKQAVENFVNKGTVPKDGLEC
ncbi:alpha/beta hydrolase [Propionibacteriaceae bacterium G1746]|uniref:alpha/beta hydrolase n=1 Tax=Aestuariimicrobium sp. G57 TaxID=3418485 RepID=UPI003C2422BF